MVGGAADAVDELVQWMHGRLAAGVVYRPGHGLLLCGAPGSGKSHLPAAVARAAGPGLSVVWLDGSALLRSSAAETAEGIAEAFAAAAARVPVLVVLEQLDAVGGEARPDGGGGGVGALLEARAAAAVRRGTWACVTLGWF